MTKPAPAPRIAKSDAEWRAQLSELAFHVTRRGGTEKRGSHDRLPEGPGVFHCVCCDAPLFDAASHYDSGSGWPSFFAPIRAEALGESEDRRMFMRRTEVHCAVCAAHLGHVFEDGPEPTGLRYCVNGVALCYRPAGPDEITS